MEDKLFRAKVRIGHTETGKPIDKYVTAHSQEELEKKRKQRASISSTGSRYRKPQPFTSTQKSGTGRGRSPSFPWPARRPTRAASSSTCSRPSG